MAKKYVIKDVILIKVLKAELSGCRLAIQCDMGSTYDYKRISAIENILQWIDSP